MARKNRLSRPLTRAGVRSFGKPCSGRSPMTLNPSAGTLRVDTREVGNMLTIKEAADDFLAHERIAVTGVSRTPGNHGANFVYRRLRERGYEVFAVNPNATEVEGDKA